MKHVKLFEDLEDDQVLKMAKVSFLSKLNLIKWEAAQWMQFVDYEYDKKKDVVIFNFKSSTYSIMFDIEVKAFSLMHGEPFYRFNDLYNFFKSVKYNEYEN